MIKLKKIIWLGFVLFLINGVSAQETDLDGYNDYSLRPIHKYDQMYKRTLWYYMDLREKQNRPFFSENSWISKVIIDAVKAGIVRPFQSDSLVNRMSYEDFIKNLTIPGAGGGGDDFGGDDFGGGGDDWGGGGDDWGGGDDGWGDDGGGGGDDFGGGDESGGDADEGDGDGGGEEIVNEFFANQLYIIEIKEDLIFDKKRSQMKHDIQTITIKIPAEVTPTGIEKPLASFSYKELVNNVFRDNPAAIWYNNSNLAEHKNFADAFELRLFSAHLIKYANFDDSYIEDIYGVGKNALIASQQIEHELIDYEQDLWEN